MSEQVAATRAAQEHPIHLVVNDDLRRSRLTVFFRYFLAIPHFFVVTLWSLAVWIVAIVNWVATLIAGRSPQGMHDFLARFQRYSTHLTAYLNLVADPFPGFAGNPGTYPVDLEIAPPERQGRLGVAFRVILAIPAMLIAGVLQSVMAILAFVGWFYALATGRMSEGMRNLSAYCLRYSAQTNSYVLLLTSRYPSLGSGPSA